MVEAKTNPLSVKIEGEQSKTYNLFSRLADPIFFLAARSWIIQVDESLITLQEFCKVSVLRGTRLNVHTGT